VPRPLATLFAPVLRPAIFQRRETRLWPSETEASFHLNGVTLRGWVTNPGAERALVYFGGNAEQVGVWRESLVEHFPDHTGYLIAYRGYGASRGRPTERWLVADGVALVDEAAGRHPGGVDVVGRSLGSGVAVQVAVARPSVRRLVLVTPFDSAVAVAQDHVGRFPVTRLMADRFASFSVASRIGMPTLVISAGRDEVVRPDRTDALVAALPEGAEVLGFPDADHDSVAHDPSYWPAVRAFLSADPARTN